MVAEDRIKYDLNKSFLSKRDIFSFFNKKLTYKLLYFMCTDYEFSNTEMKNESRGFLRQYFNLV